MEKRVTSVRLTQAFRNFFETERASAVILIACTILSLVLANFVFGEPYELFWIKTYLGIGPDLFGFVPGVPEFKLSVEHWINDGLMAVFFLLIGLELQREIYVGELSSLRRALLPVFAAIGGMAVPAGIHYAFNGGTQTSAGIGIPMATDIAFALGVLSLLGNRVPASLKVFLAALAVIDDLGAIIVIALFYTAKLEALFLALAIGVFVLLLVLNRLKVMMLAPYIIGGLFMWFFMYKSGVHATIAGVLLAFTIPFRHKLEGKEAPSEKMEHKLHTPVAFMILPIFALANTGIIVNAESLRLLDTPNSLGIILGLSVGKPVGIALLTLYALVIGVCKLPLDLNIKHVLGAGMLGGIGFTMSIFITNLAFKGSLEMINSSKMDILLASLVSGAAGFLFLKFFGQPNVGDTDMDTMDFELDNGNGGGSSRQ
jgi:NhaA family Na+:H+ antiporter